MGKIRREPTKFGNKEERKRYRKNFKAVKMVDLSGWKMPVVKGRKREDV